MERSTDGKFIGGAKPVESEPSPDSGNDIASDSELDSDEREAEFIDPAAVTAERTGQPAKPAKRKPGRQKGWSPKRKEGPQRQAPLSATPEPKAVIDVDGLSKILLSIHAMAAAATSSPELKLLPEEAQLLSASGAKVAAHYNLAPSEKVQDWCALIMVCGQIYYPRVNGMRLRQNEERAAKRAAKAASIETMPPIMQSNFG